MARRKLEPGGDRGLIGAAAHQRGVGAHAEREAEAVEEDRLAGPGFTGQHAKSRLELQLQPVDQDDIVDGQLPKHAARAQLWVAACGEWRWINR